MKQYGQFCPIAKSAEILGDPWSILIVRELLLGSSRFSVLQRGLPRISPTVLNTRLKELEDRGVIIKRRLSGQRGHEYRLTAAGRELSAVIEALAVWGMRWVRSELGTATLTREVAALRCGLDDAAWDGAGKEQCVRAFGRAAPDKTPDPLPFDHARAHKLYMGLFGEVQDLIKGK